MLGGWWREPFWWQRHREGNSELTRSAFSANQETDLSPPTPSPPNIKPGGRQKFPRTRSTVWTSHHRHQAAASTPPIFSRNHRSIHERTRIVYTCIRGSNRLKSSGLEIVCISRILIPGVILDAPVERPSLRLHATGSFIPWWTRRPQRLPSCEDIPLSFDEIGEGRPTNLSAFERLVLTRARRVVQPRRQAQDCEVSKIYPYPPVGRVSIQMPWWPSKAHLGPSRRYPSFLPPVRSSLHLVSRPFRATVRENIQKHDRAEKGDLEDARHEGI